MPRLLPHLRPLKPTLLLLRPYSSLRPRPAPPKLPAEQQAEFERLQRSAAVSAAFQPTPEEQQKTPNNNNNKEEEDVNQGLFRGAKPEFEGDKNPKTGEVGGPKNEPLRWGASGDWSYNGRVTDF
ncbi:hypothetical protein ACRE_064580 [Hapsidospora chrysogenum ATCC 11550]|uniref:Succinate dehydrogenase assembly factor 4, mitochondrial n=1 Tax=Hapsidospora chrysogenum (strain ATCC 11550 / CBS 779.69 / DSM 880 / IAM 14645 / JCM 23072 / IMI 49137) TaxID=857340 RepID=A0A086T082_HAPC1|nr:hypothetical protein ACRE_064580 [Hapsidospora chrysogenum ATCC 11550]